MRIAIVVLLALSLAGCARWTKPGASSEDFQRDSYECERDARAVSYSFWFTWSGFYRRCLYAHGWRHESNDEPPPPSYYRQPEESAARPGPATPRCEWGSYWDNENARCQRIPE